MPLENLAGEVVVTAAGDDEFELIAFGEAIEIGQEVVFALEARRAFDVHDANDARIDMPDVQRAVGLQQVLAACVAEAGKQIEAAGLQQRFAAGQFDELASVVRDGTEDFIGGHLAAAALGVRGVVPVAAEIAAGQAHHNARPAGACAFALDGEEYLADVECIGHCGYFTGARSIFGART